VFSPTILSLLHGACAFLQTLHEHYAQAREEWERQRKHEEEAMRGAWDEWEIEREEWARERRALLAEKEAAVERLERYGAVSMIFFCVYDSFPCSTSPREARC
jgi:hypothetical protein